MENLLLDKKRVDTIVSVVLKDFINERSYYDSIIESTDFLKKVEELKSSNAELVLMKKILDTLKDFNKISNIAFVASHIEEAIDDAAKKLALIEFKVELPISNYDSREYLKNALTAKLLLTNITSYEELIEMSFNFLESIYEPKYASLDNIHEFRYL
jgi:3-dehydroquinate dehydratase